MVLGHSPLVYGPFFSYLEIYKILLFLEIFQCLKTLPTSNPQILELPWIPLTVTIPRGSLAWLQGTPMTISGGMVRAWVIFISSQLMQCSARVGNLCSGPWDSRWSPLLTMLLCLHKLSALRIVFYGSGPCPQLWSEISLLSLQYGVAGTSAASIKNGSLEEVARPCAHSLVPHS